MSEKNESIQELFERVSEEVRQHRAMLNRALGKSGKHRHVWIPVGRITPITRPLRLGKKHSTKMWDCPLCGATKYRGRLGTEVLPA